MHSYNVGILLRNASFNGGCKVVTDRLRNEFQKVGIVVKCFSLVPSNSPNYIDINVFSKKKLDSNEILLIKKAIIDNGINNLIIQVDSPLSAVFDVKLLDELFDVCKLYCVFHNSTCSYFKVYRPEKISHLELFLRQINSRINQIPKTSKRLRHNVKLADYITLSCKSQKDLIEKISMCKSTVIPNCIPEIEPGLQQKENVCVYVGRLDKYQKNIYLLINAWKRINDRRGWKLILVGSGREEKAIRNYCKNDHDIRIVGSKTNSEMLELLKTTKILTISSDYEGIPTVAIEAMAVGNAIISTNFDGIDDSFLRNGYNCIISSSNVVDYSNNLQKLIADEKMQVELADNGRRLYEKMNNEIVIQKWNKSFEED